MSVDSAEVRRVAQLARLELTEAELATMTGQLRAILEYVDQLRQIDTSNVMPLEHPLPLQNVFRDDEPTPSLPPDRALANAPERRNDYFSVPAVLE